MIGKYGQKFSIECRKMSEITIVLLYFAYAKRKPIATWSYASSRVFPRLPALFAVCLVLLLILIG